MSSLVSIASLRREGDYSFRKCVDRVIFSGDKYALCYKKLNRNGGEFLKILMNNEVAYADE